MNHLVVQHGRTEIGEVVLASFQGRLCLLSFRHRHATEMFIHGIARKLNAELIERHHALLEEARRQLDEYLAGDRTAFDIPLLMLGTDFQKSVWNALLKVPYGATQTYRQIAEAVGNTKAVRAVGNACKANPVGIIVPCHRIIGSDGDLVGYGGGLSLKRRLLKLERGGSAAGND
ncbi:MAG: methylated-DNA--[protein]-cysteine S-methyltransferase [Dehalococcoidia bacterium]